MRLFTAVTIIQENQKQYISPAIKDLKYDFCKKRHSPIPTHFFSFTLLLKPEVKFRLFERLFTPRRKVQVNVFAIFIQMSSSFQICENLPSQVICTL